jgi:hypothetical protein
VIDWRGLFGAIGVPWKDRGANHAKGNVNIKCPWCFADPSEHLGVSEERDAYYCYRDPRHAGTNLVGLLLKLGVKPRHEAVRLLNGYRRGAPVASQAKEILERDISLVQRSWNRFHPLQDIGHQHGQALDYLQSRGFMTPRAVAALYGLRYAKEGQWAGRVLFPFKTPTNELYTWAGRAVWPEITPPYLMEDEKVGGACYEPRAARSTCVIVEGPMDALKVCAATEQQDISALALCGKYLDASKLIRIRAALRNSDAILVALDDDVAVATQVYHIIDLLKSAVGMGKRVVRKRMPIGVGDPGEMSYAQVREWLGVN